MRASNFLSFKNIFGAPSENENFTSDQDGLPVLLVPLFLAGWILQLLNKQLYKYSRCMYHKYYKFQMVVTMMKKIKQGMGISYT